MDYIQYHHLIFLSTAANTQVTDPQNTEGRVEIIYQLLYITHSACIGLLYTGMCIDNQCNVNERLSNTYEITIK